MSEITYEYIRDYLFSFENNESQMIQELRKYAIAHHVPIIKHEAKSFIELIMTMKKPKKILEIGTAIGYSALVMNEVLEGNVEITTIERSEDMIKVAKENFKKYGGGKITLLEGDAIEHLKGLTDSYDVIFMDAAKGQYLTFLPYCKPLLKSGGLLISDNVLQDGYVAKSRWSIPRRQRTIHRRMRQYLTEIKNDEMFKTNILPIADGMALSYKY